MSKFKHISKLIREKRLANKRNLSQAELSRLLGDKDGKLISNVERGICSVSPDIADEVCRILNINQDEMAEALRLDRDAIN